MKIFHLLIIVLWLIVGCTNAKTVLEPGTSKSIDVQTSVQKENMTWELNNVTYANDNYNNRISLNLIVHNKGDHSATVSFSTVPDELSDNITLADKNKAYSLNWYSAGNVTTESTNHYTMTIPGNMTSIRYDFGFLIDDSLSKIDYDSLKVTIPVIRKLELVPSR